MARFDVYRNPGEHAREFPFLLDVQSELLADMETRVVVPLRRCDKFPCRKVPGDLVPVFAIDGIDCMMQTPLLAAVPARILKKPVVSMGDERQRIVAALDFLFDGF